MVSAVPLLPLPCCSLSHPPSQVVLFNLRQSLSQGQLKSLHPPGMATVFLNDIEAVCSPDPATTQTSPPSPHPQLAPLQPHQSPCSSLSMKDEFLPLALCGCCSFCLERDEPPLVSQVSSHAAASVWPSWLSPGGVQGLLPLLPPSLLVPVALLLLLSCSSVSPVAL